MNEPMNKNPCGTCEHFDPVLRGRTGPGGTRPTAWAWCSARSQYPAYEGPGQRFPEEALRVQVGELAKPYIVRPEQVVGHCTMHKVKARGLSKQDLLKQMDAR